MTTAVFDCMVFVQAAANDQGPAFACLSLVESGTVVLLASPPILAEVRDVLSRPKLQAKFPHLTTEHIDLFLQKIGQMAMMIQDVPVVLSLPRDPDDEPYLNLALSSKVEYLVTRDKDLLDLRADEEFMRRFPGITVVDPVDFLKVARSSAG